MAPSVEQQLATAVQNRARFFQRVQLAFDLIDKEEKKNEFEVRLVRCDDAFTKFELVSDQINLLSSQVKKQEDVVETINSAKAFEEMFFQVKAYKARLDEARAQVRAANVLNNTSSQIPANLPKVNLPTIHIPIFDGDITVFPSWSGLYNELVHTSEQLTDIQKFSYLKSYLKGSAAQCVETISFTSANYPLAYKAIHDRYGKKRTLATTLMNKLLDYKPMNKDSVVDLQSFLDGFYVVVESLKSLAIANLDEFVLLHLGMRVLDNKSVVEFEREMVRKEFPEFKDLVMFVRNKAQILLQSSESCITPSTSQAPIPHKYQKNLPKYKFTMVSQKSEKHCYVCSEGPHKLSTCPQFLKFSPSKRFSVVKEMKLCYACLSTTHSASKCESTYRCRTCGSNRHHSLLHVDNQQSSTQQGSTAEATISGVANANQYHQANSSSTILLGTATIQVQSKLGDWVSARCVVDPGSQVSIISEKLAQSLNLSRKYCNINISGVGSSTVMRTKGQVDVCVLPEFQNKKFIPNQFPLTVKAVIMPKIMASLPGKITSSVLQRFNHLKLADRSYYNDSSDITIDLLLGAEHYEDIIIHSLPMIKGMPTAVPSIFGYLLIGRVSETISSHPTSYSSLFISSMEDPISSQLQKFWALEEVETVIPIKKEDQECEELFISTHSRTKEGRYQVKLPFIKDASSLGSNREKAMRLFRSLENRLNFKEPRMKSLYCDNLQSYLEMDHMAIAKKPSDYLLAHHGVYRETSETTKLRVVFSPNVVSTTGQSLSSVLCVGPKLQLDIQDILILFRLHVVAISCDIQAMYRNILVAPEDRKFQHIFWRADCSQKVQEYELKTVTFGLPPSPYLAQRVIKQLALDEQDRFPDAAKVLLESIYVDDIVTGSDNVLSAQRLRDQLISLLQSGGFSLRRWTTSHPEVLSDFTSDETPHLLGSSESVKVLGIQWCPKTDTFKYSVSVNPNMNITKRSVLSCIATIYDVNGFLSPLIVYMKIFMQQLWLNKDDSWDTPLPDHLRTQWCKLLKELPLLHQIRIPRFILEPEYTSIQLIGCCDAATQAISAVLYLRIVHETGVHVGLLRGKTKVAPLKVQSINRLELNGCLILAKLVKSVSFLIEKLNIDQIFLFSDSKTALSWLRIQPYLLKTYVANRVVQILELTNPSDWYHIASENNSADPASRGLTPSQLLDCELWFQGPKFLYSEQSLWPMSRVKESCDQPELKNSTVSLAVQENHKSDFINIFQRYSSLSKLQRVIGYTLRFIHNLKHPLELRKSGTLSVDEMKESLFICLKISQSVYFSDDIKLLQKRDQVSSYLRPLSPIIDSRGLLVVGGRLANASIPDHAKHPIILSKQCHVTLLIIRMFHLITLHGGPSLVQSLIHQRYWIINARNIIRSVIFKCVACTKMKAKPLQPIMADLPKSRVTQGRPFINTGVDFAGPFSYKTGPRRNSPIDKCYLAVFICMATKCVHLELVSSLSTIAFLATLDRFISRRGLPNVIFSDNGTNFRGAASYMNEVQNFLKGAHQTITNHLVTQEVTWSFIAPSAPNFGGLWEAAVKSAKSHLKHVLHGHSLNFEEFSTLAVKIEAILNSRPLCPLSPYPSDRIETLTPGHFLIGAPLIARPEHDMSDENVSPLKRWNLIIQATQSFWKRWLQDYLHTLLQRSKWTKPTNNIKLNDVVLIHGQQQAVHCWPLGVVVRLHPGSDGTVRVVTVRTSHGELKRPVNKLILLPVNE